MSVAEFAYAQARIEARHGERLQDADWKALESAQSLSRYLELARSTALKRFVAQIGPDFPAHAVERVVRREAALYAREVAAWAPRRWRPAIAWIAALPLLPLVDGLDERSSLTGWVSDDAALGAFSANGAEDPDAVVRGLARLLDGAAAPRDIGRSWLRRWRALWPKGETTSADLGRLVSETHRVLASERGRQDARGPAFRADLARILTRFFRSHGMSAVALVCHIGLVLIDVERLRGGLVRRSLFGAEEERLAERIAA
jgi:hypothetical protein